ncbi:MAG: hypothetical protein U1E15_00745 [Hyphomicrobiales bacterium]
MWRDVFLNNEAAVEMLRRFTEELAVLQRAIRWATTTRCLTCFRAARNPPGHHRGEPGFAVPNFGRDPDRKA